VDLTLLLDMAVDGFGDRVLAGRKSGGITAAQLASRSHSGAGLVREHGAEAVVYLAVNGPAFPVALFAAARAGVPLVPLNYRLGQRQLDALLARHPKALGIADPDSQLHFERAGLDALTTDEWLAQTGIDRGAASGPRGSEEGGGEDAVAIVIYTSGTTSEPKGVLLRHENLVSYVLGSVEFASASEAEAALVSVPPYHIAAVANVITNLYAGRRTLVLEDFTPGQWLRAVREQEVTSAMVVPTMLARIMDSAEDKSVPSLRSLSYGGAPMPAALIERALREWAQVDFVNAYGLTETSSTVALLGPEDHRAALESPHPAVRARLSSIGKPLPGIELEIRGPGGEILGPGQPGRICVRGEQVSAEYAGLGRAVDDRGFFDTKDDGYLDSDGYLFISGRTDDTIIRGAENIAPAEIEDVLLRHPAVLDAAVFGVPDQEWGQRIEAAVVTRPGMAVEAGELRAFTRQALRSSKTPDRFWFLDALPRTETGKLLRRLVPDLIAPAEPRSRRLSALEAANPAAGASGRRRAAPWSASAARFPHRRPEKRGPRRRRRAPRPGRREYRREAGPLPGASRRPSPRVARAGHTTPVRRPSPPCTPGRGRSARRPTQAGRAASAAPRSEGDGGRSCRRKRHALPEPPGSGREGRYGRSGEPARASPRPW
jgi:acyl-CoA synthetase (AMP-forming)/AMP-acid ligase II